LTSTPPKRDLILTTPRQESVVLRVAGIAPAIIRDQKPMKFIAEKIDPESSLAEYLLAINSRVFFWASRSGSPVAPGQGVPAPTIR
jgi:hypothetical protein